MPNSQSHLFSLATLLESAEQRQSSLPPPPLATAPPEDDSGLIDILAMQARAREASARPSSRTPLPVVSTHYGTAARRASTDPDIAAAYTMSAKRKQMLSIIGGVAAGIALIAFAIGFASSAPTPAPVRMAAVQAPPPPAVAAIPPPPPAPETTTAPVPQPAAVAAADDSPKPKKAKKKRKSSHASHPSPSHGGPSLMKIISGGTAP